MCTGSYWKCSGRQDINPDPQILTKHVRDIQGQGSSPNNHAPNYTQIYQTIMSIKFVLRFAFFSARPRDSSNYRIRITVTMHNKP